MRSKTQKQKSGRKLSNGRTAGERRRKAVIATAEPRAKGSETHDVLPEVPEVGAGQLLSGGAEGRRGGGGAAAEEVV